MWNHLIVLGETDETSANAIFSSDCSEKYHISGCNAITDGNKYKDVDIIEISEAEYNNLKSMVVEKTIDENGNEIDLSHIKNQKIEELKEVCNKTITSGFDIILSDGINYHFSLELTDQLKISKLNDRAINGVTELPWHVDNGLCKFYKADDIIAINQKMEYFIEYHTTYFNSLKNYIKNIGDKNDIINIYYGIEIPKPYQSEVLMEMLSVTNGGI